MFKSMSVRLSVLAVACLVSATALALADTPKSVNVPSGDLVPALEMLAKQCGVDVIYPSAQLKGFKTQGVSGTLEPKDAFGKLIEGTPLILKEQGGSVLISLPAPASTSSASGNPSDAAAQDQQKEGKKDSSGAFRLAQASSGQDQGTVQVEKQEEETAKKKSLIQEVVVTGSRIPTPEGNEVLPARVYTKGRIEQSGQSTVADFLNTLPDVSISIGENGSQTAYGATTVQLHGLPIGTTLVLIDGRRVESAGSNASFGINFFDLSNIPLAAVERIEVVPEGSSAIYGSDAIAGVVNIILRKDLNGFEVNTKNGWATDIHESTSSAAWGRSSDKGSISIIASYQDRSNLDTSQRFLTASNNYTAFGGTDNNFSACNPGTVFSIDGVTPLPGLGTATYAAVPAGYTGKPSIAEFVPTAGTLNECSLNKGVSVIPPTNRAAVIARGNYALSSTMELFADLMYSRVRQDPSAGYPSLFGEVGFQNYTVSAGNPFNPFGTDVGIGYLITDLGKAQTPITTDFLRPVVGLRGDLFSSWHWEVAGWDAKDRTSITYTNQVDSTALQNALDSTNPATALNPFTAGSPGSQQLLQSLVFDQFLHYKSETRAANGFLRGPLAYLPSGPIEVVVGGEYNWDSLYTNKGNSILAPVTTFDRHLTAIFGEARIPIIGDAAKQENGQTLVATLAGRYDHYNDFGGKTTPQFGAVWRPLESLVFRATYGDAFKAPGLYDLYRPPITVLRPVIDPLLGNRVEIVPQTYGGNPGLKPETGASRTFGLVYSSKLLPGFQFSVTSWRVVENDSIQFVSAQTLVNNESLFSGHVTRGPGSNGLPGPITAIDVSYVNYGRIDVDGVDFQVDYKYGTRYGEISPSLSVTETYRYSASLVPQAPPNNRVSVANDDGSWAPRWKGSVALGWKLGACAASVSGRYVSKYQDYDSTSGIGNFWISDANLRYDIGRTLATAVLKGAYAEVGGVNIFNKLPQYSNYFFGLWGYDPAEADIRGRFLYAQVGVKW